MKVGTRSGGGSLRRRRWPSVVFCALLQLPAAVGAETPDVDKASRNYYVYVCAESEDEVALLRFGPDGLAVEKVVPVGSFPAEIEGPHGIAVAADGRHWYVSISHGQPFGSIHRYETGSDDWVGDTRVGMFPASLDVSATTGLLYVVNSDFYGDHQPSTISVVETSTMTEVAQVATGTMPHGARLSRDGTFLYSVNMMDDELVELDAQRFAISRRLRLVAPSADAHAGGGHAHTGRSEPAWVSAPTAAQRVYVAALSGNVIFEVGLERFAVERVFTGGAAGPYNLDLTADGQLLVVTYKKGDAVGFWDVERAVELALVPTTRRLPHGVVITSDGRFSLVTNEGVGGEPGVVEVYDNRSFRRIATAEIGKQAGGIALWRGHG